MGDLQSIGYNGQPVQQAFRPVEPPMAVIVDLAALFPREPHSGGGYNPAGESHFNLAIESAAFASMNRVQRQRAVYAALGELMDERVHALSIRASAPGEE